ncbi:hypothetical protein BKA70DRAFT_1443254 [Coprinopsis sp. MPI-PUGE-AT-0042]|nr:hypothetical protein BKA70DRAFT_1443254 [Coprinopsis sp. MPI-PUGE-AT-0042]
MQLLNHANVGIKNNQRALDTVSEPLGAALGPEEQELHSPVRVPPCGTPPAAHGLCCYFQDGRKPLNCSLEAPCCVMGNVLILLISDARCWMWKLHGVVLNQPKPTISPRCLRLSKDHYLKSASPAEEWNRGRHLPFDASIATPLDSPVTLAFGAQQLAKQIAIVARITTTDELADFHAFSTENITVASPVLRTRNQSSIDARAVDALIDGARPRPGIAAQLQAFQPPIGKRAKITYRDQQQTQTYPKGTSCVIIELCTRHKTYLADAEDYAIRGFHALIVAYE